MLAKESQKLRLKALQRCWGFSTEVFVVKTVSGCLSGWSLRQVTGQYWKLLEREAQLITDLYIHKGIDKCCMVTGDHPRVNTQPFKPECNVRSPHG